MKIIYISIAVLILSVGGYFAYQWYKGKKTTIPATNNTTTAAVTALPHVIVQGMPIAVHVTALATK